MPSSRKPGNSRKAHGICSSDFLSQVNQKYWERLTLFSGTIVNGSQASPGQNRFQFGPRKKTPTPVKNTHIASKSSSRPPTMTEKARPGTVPGWLPLDLLRNGIPASPSVYTAGKTQRASQGSK